MNRGRGVRFATGCRGFDLGIGGRGLWIAGKLLTLLQQERRRKVRCQGRCLLTAHAVVTALLQLP